MLITYLMLIFFSFLCLDTTRVEWYIVNTRYHKYARVGVKVA